jgi:hypothetical protein
MAALPIVAISEDMLQRCTRHELTQHIYGLYRRQDALDDHEARLRLLHCALVLPAMEAPVSRKDDQWLSTEDLGLITAHALHLQRRLDEYLVTFHDIYKAVDRLSPRPYQKSGLYRKGASREQWLARRAELAKIRRAKLPKTTTVKLVNIDGITKTIKEWSKDPRCSVKFTAIYKRIRDGWSCADAIFTPAEQAKVAV